jgi:hypothetical protein
LAERLLAQRFFQYAMFTSALERRAVNPAVTLIADGQSGVELALAMERDGARILVDESFHALESDIMIDKAIGLSGITPASFGTPSFLQKLELETQGKSDKERRLLTLAFAFVSETLISNLLNGIPHDTSVVPEVRDYVREHAKDEARHHQFFMDFFAIWWPRLRPEEREFAGPYLPHFIRWFLEPDLTPFVPILKTAGIPLHESEKIIAATLAANDSAALQQSAVKTIRAVFDIGALDIAAVADAFAEVIGVESINQGGVV